MRLLRPQSSDAPWFAIACVIAMLLFAVLGVVTKPS